MRAGGADKDARKRTFSVVHPRGKLSEEGRNMGNLNIGLAMVAARLATSKTEKELEDRKQRESRASYSEPGRKPDYGKPFLPGAKMEVVNGKLILIPSVESTRSDWSRGWTLTREDKPGVRVDTGKVIRSPKPK
jgi:hypothetical protein